MFVEDLLQIFIKRVRMLACSFTVLLICCLRALSLPLFDQRYYNFYFPIEGNIFDPTAI